MVDTTTDDTDDFDEEAAALEQEIAEGTEEAKRKLLPGIIQAKIDTLTSEKRRTTEEIARKRRQKAPALDELISEFVVYSTPSARTAGYPSPETGVKLVQLAHAAHIVFHDQLQRSGYIDFYREQKAALGKRLSGEALAEAEEQLQRSHDVRRLYELPFEKKDVPDALVNEAIRAFNSAKAALVGLYFRNGLFHGGWEDVARWMTDFVYGAVERNKIKTEEGKEIVIAYFTPHSSEYIKNQVTKGGIFLLESLVAQLLKFPTALPRPIITYEQVEKKGHVRVIPVLKSVHDATREEPDLFGDFKKYRGNLNSVISLARQTSDVLTTLEEYKTAALLEKGANSIDNLVDAGAFFNERERSKVVVSLFEAMASIRELPFSEHKAYALKELDDEKIEMVFRAAELYYEVLREVLSVNGVPLGKPYFVEISDHHRTILGAGMKDKKIDDVSKELLVRWINRCRSDEAFTLSAFYGEHPYAMIGNALECFNIPEQTAKDFEQLLQDAIFRDQDPQTFVHMPPKERAPRKAKTDAVHENLLKENTGEKYAQSLRAVMEELSGRYLPPFYATTFHKGMQFKEGERRIKDPQYSNGIRQEITAYGHDEEGNLVDSDRTNFHRGDTALLNRWKGAYPEHELYLGGNMGVAWVFHIDMGWPKNPAWSHIELLIDHGDKEKSEMGDLVDRVQVAFHETRHIGQIGSRLMWRYLAVHVAEFFAKYALEKYDDQSLDMEAVFTDFGLRDIADVQSSDVFSSKLKHPITLREHILKWFTIFNTTALGVGKRAELLRDHGPYKGALLYNDDGTVCDPKKYAIKDDAHLSASARERSESILEESAVLGVIDTVPWEISKTAQLVGSVYDAIENLDMNRIDAKSRKSVEAVLYQCRRARTELSTIIETDAEVSGLYCTREALKRALAGDDKKSTEMEDAWGEKLGLLSTAGYLGKQGFAILRENDYQVTPAAKDLLKKIGIRYVQMYDHEEASKVVPANWKKLGFESHGQVWCNPQRMEQRLKEYNDTHPDNPLCEDDLRLPLNSARIDIQCRYRAHIPQFMSVVNHVGFKEAIKIFEAAESLEDMDQAEKECRKRWYAQLDAMQKRFVTPA